MGTAEFISTVAVGPGEKSVGAFIFEQELGPITGRSIKPGGFVLEADGKDNYNQEG